MSTSTQLQKEADYYIRKTYRLMLGFSYFLVGLLLLAAITLAFIDDWIFAVLSLVGAVPSMMNIPDMHRRYREVADRQRSE